GGVRFAGGRGELAWSVVYEPVALWRGMVDGGEVAALRPERVWKETARALATGRPDVFISVLRECGALAKVFPEIDALFGVPQPARRHPAIAPGVHVLLVLRIAAALSVRPVVPVASL